MYWLAIQTSANSGGRRDVMAEAILACENVEQLPPDDSAAMRALLLAVLAEFAEDFLVSNGPGNAGNWNRQDEQPRYLKRQCHGLWLDAIKSDTDDARIKMRVPGHNSED